MLDNHLLFTATDLKQYTYCARVIFYEHCLPHIRPRTYKMDAGNEAHELERQHAARRTFAGYDLSGGRRCFDLHLSSTRLNLVGVVDEVVYGDNGDITLVDYKLAKHVGQNHRIQLAAYALLLEEAEQVVVPHGFIYLIPKRKLAKVHITTKLRQEVTTRLSALAGMIEREQMPAPAARPNQCVSCEFRRFCNDV